MSARQMRLGKPASSPRARETRPLKLLVANGGFVETYEIDYHDGIRYPHLERVEGTSDYLDEIIKPLAAENVTGLSPAEGRNALKHGGK